MTIKDVARELGVSVSLVSKAFNDYDDIGEEKKKYIIEEAKKMGYIPNVYAANLARKSNTKIALLMRVNDDDQFIDEINMLFTATCFREIKNVDYEPLVIFTELLESMSPLQVLTYMQAQGIAGVIIYGNADADYLSELLKDNKIKKVVIDEPLKNDSTSVITIDNEQAQYDIAKLMCAPNSIKSILYIQGSQLTNVGVLRNRGFERFMDEFPDKLYVQVDGKFFDEEAFDIVMCSNEKFDAIVCASDMMAMGAVKACFKKGIYPIILGFDGIKLIKYTHMKIVTVKQPFKLVAINSVKEVVNLIKGSQSRIVCEEYEIIEN